GGERQGGGTERVKVTSKDWRFDWFGRTVCWNTRRASCRCRKTASKRNCVRFTKGRARLCVFRPSWRQGRREQIRSRRRRSRRHSGSERGFGARRSCAKRRVDSSG